MNLLIVDDEYLVVEEVVTVTDWELLGITEIYSATNAVSAVRILNEKKIDIMICDIEMPKENGKTRPLSIYSYEDKLVQEALRKVLESVFEPHFYSNMCGFRTNRNCHGAIRMLNDKI